MNNRLSKTFGLPTQESLDEIVNEIEINIPENAELRDIVKLALGAYKAQIDQMKNIEPRYRAHQFEVAQLYLSTAMDAIEKDRQIQLKKAKLDHDIATKPLAKDPLTGKSILMEGEQTREQLLQSISKQNRHPVN